MPKLSLQYLPLKHVNELPRCKLRGIKRRSKERSKLLGINPAEIKPKTINALGG